MDKLFNVTTHISRRWIYRSAKIVWTKKPIWVYSSSPHKWGRNNKNHFHHGLVAHRLRILSWTSMRIDPCSVKFTCEKIKWRWIEFIYVGSVRDHSQLPFVINWQYWYNHSIMRTKLVRTACRWYFGDNNGNRILRPIYYLGLSHYPSPRSLMVM